MMSAMDHRSEIENLRRSIAMLAPGTQATMPREDALGLLSELQDVTGRLNELKRRLRILAEEG